MKKFLFKIALFFILTLLGLAVILIQFGGYIDYFYEKFTVPKRTSLILGDSRSLQGIQPRIINEELKDEGYSLPIFNYSFTIAQINYGKPYTESVIKKLAGTQNGLFIVSVNPWLFTEREQDNTKAGIYSERSNPPHNMLNVNSNPNFEYFFRNFKYFHMRSIVRKTVKLHKDGWLEESNLPKDSTQLNQWKDHQVSLYQEFSKKWSKSPKRMRDFTEMVKFLQQYGRVVLVRMPVDAAILNVENKFWSKFDGEMSTLAKEHHIRYFDFSKSNNFRTYDGNHIDKYGGVVFTKELCESIKVRKK